MTLALRYAALSDVGRVRRKNEDSGFASGTLLVVADGMGGAAAGELASSVTVETLRRLDNAAPDSDMLEALAGAVHRANDRLGEIIDEDPRVEGMGTTVTAAMFDGTQIGLAHIGDSRAYLLRNHELSRLTHDHTFVQSLVDEGRITEQEARTHPHRSLILKALDGRHDTDPDLTMHTLQPGDRVLLCSDGLCGFVEDDVIRGVLTQGTIDSACVELTQLALEAGGHDNITCVVGEATDAASPVDPESAGAMGPLLVGAAAEQSRGRLGDTASHAPVGDDVVDREFVPDPEELRYAPRPPRRFRWLRRLVLLIVIAALVVIGGKFAYDWTQDQYFVADYEDSVAIYQGVDAELPFMSLSSVHEETPLKLTALPTYWRDRVVQGMDAKDLEHAQSIVGSLEDQAEACLAAQREEESGPKQTGPKQSPTATPRRDRQGGRTPDGKQTTNPSPTESPTDDTIPPDPSCQEVAE